MKTRIYAAPAVKGLKEVCCGGTQILEGYLHVAGGAVVIYAQS